jgi:hypothetical protein
MGLLGNGWEDPQSAAIMALAGGLLQGNFAGGLLGANSAYSEAGDKKLRRSLLESQIEENKLQGKEREAKLATLQRRQSLLDSVFGAGGLNAPQVSPGAFRPDGNGYGPTMPPSMEGMSRQGTRMASLNFDQLAQLKEAGLDLVDLHKYANDPLKLEQGSTYVDRVSGQSRYMPKIGEGIAPDKTGFYAPLPGYVASVAQMEGAKTGANEAAKAQFDLVQTYNPETKQMEFRPRAQVVRDSTPGQPQRAPVGNTGGSEAGLRPLMTGGMGADPAAIKRELQQSKASLAFIKDPASRSQMQAYIADLERQGQAVGVSGGGVAAGPSANQKLADDAGGKINESWVKTSYEPTLSAGAAARDLADTVKVTRQAMENMGGTGWGTQAKAAGASVLSGLGIAPQNAQLFAANAQLFQKTAMERLWSTLNEAKGPQTEGDADRASKTYASLANTPQANSFILDMAQAKAERDAIKARFYQQAMPIARQKGDLSEVDREWSKRAPSIFNMPTMQRWTGGIK